MAESDVDPPGPIPNPVVTHVSAGEYYGPGPWEARPLRAPQTARNGCQGVTHRTIDTDLNTIDFPMDFCET